MRNLIYQELINKLELAICDLLKAKKTDILDNLKKADIDSEYRIISFNVFPWDDWIQLSFGTRGDQRRFLNTVADWKYFNLCNSDEIQSENISSAIKAMSEYYDEDAGDTEQTIIFFAAAQALMSTKVWHYYNQLQLSICIEKKQMREREGKTPAPINSLIKEASSDKPLLYCMVTHGDLSAEANYCEIINAIGSLNDNVDEVLNTILRDKIL